ncbi:hypothetical protein NDU88_005694 [Pleurodeles waltl]|uniref:Uncharacterized protein n=1 Tax=Pleurodeles waltl TaxID=8319 RepID=A0AAV7NPQ3_PLEWA|nr:hypothetical protein NDU88_005694 [Pleurodeles waltl]
MFTRPVQRYNVLDSLNMTAHCWQSPGMAGWITSIYLPHVSLDRCLWFPLGEEHWAVVALWAIGLWTLGNFFCDGVMCKLDQVRDRNNNPSVVTQFHYYKAHHVMHSLLGEDLLEPPELPALSHFLRTIATSHTVEIHTGGEKAGVYAKRSGSGDRDQ